MLLLSWLFFIVVLVGLPLGFLVWVRRRIDRYNTMVAGVDGEAVVAGLEAVVVGDPFFEPDYVRQTVGFAWERLIMAACLSSAEAWNVAGGVLSPKALESGRVLLELQGVPPSVALQRWGSTALPRGARLAGQRFESRGLRVSLVRVENGEGWERDRVVVWVLGRVAVVPPRDAGDAGEFQVVSVWTLAKGVQPGVAGGVGWRVVSIGEGVPSAGSSLGNVSHEGGDSLALDAFGLVAGAAPVAVGVSGVGPGLEGLVPEGGDAGGDARVRLLDASLVDPLLNPDIVVTLVGVLLREWAASVGDGDNGGEPVGGSSGLACLFENPALGVGGLTVVQGWGAARLNPPPLFEAGQVRFVRFEPSEGLLECRVRVAALFGVEWGVGVPAVAWDGVLELSVLLRRCEPSSARVGADSGDANLLGIAFPWRVVSVAWRAGVV